MGRMLFVDEKGLDRLVWIVIGLTTLFGASLLGIALYFLLGAA